MRILSVLLFGGVIALIALGFTFSRADKITASVPPRNTIPVRDAPRVIDTQALSPPILGDADEELAVPAELAKSPPVVVATPTLTSVPLPTLPVTASPTRQPVATPKQATPRATATRAIVRPTAVARVTKVPTPAAVVATAVKATPVPSSATSDWLPITQLEIPRIALRADVVPARLIQESGDTTWEVPPFRVGHAQYTAGAGQIGNAVLIGHDASLRDGAVFQSLYLARVGDAVRLASGSRTFEYRVADVRIVPRADVSVARWTPTATATLITCAGPWVPAIDDYADRLIVRAELVSRPG